MKKIIFMRVLQHDIKSREKEEYLWIKAKQKAIQ